MAEVYTVTFTLKDAKGYVASFRLHTPKAEYGTVSDSVQDLTEYCQEVATRLAAVVNGAIIGCQVSIPINVGDIKPTAEAYSDVEEGALFAINPYTRFVVPTFAHDLFPPGGIFHSLFDDELPEELFAFISFLLQPEDDVAWPAEYGGISDNRGNRILNGFTAIQKAFKRSRG